jgi:hypothetical protein
VAVWKEGEGVASQLLHERIVVTARYRHAGRRKWLCAPSPRKAVPCRCLRGWRKSYPGRGARARA